MRKSLIFLLVAVIAAGCVKAPQGAPGFVYEDLGGESWSLEALRGEVVVLYFWTGSCSVCVRKIPDLILLQDQVPEDVHFLTLNANDSKGRIQSLIGDSDLTVLMNSIKSFNDYGIAYVPTMVFIDKDGKIDQVHVGALANKNVLEIIESLR
jgi:thiol-disulfide isomerase/thioredoxin